MTAQGSRFATIQLALKRMKGHPEVGIGVFYRSDRLFDLYPDAHFLLDTPAQGALQSLLRFSLSPREFPKAAQKSAVRPLDYQ